MESASLCGTRAQSHDRQHPVEVEGTSRGYLERSTRKERSVKPPGLRGQTRICSGVGSFLIFYAISLAHPAIVDAIAGVRYAVIFLGALLLTKLRPAWLEEKFRGWQLVSKAIATCLVVAGLVLLGMSNGNREASDNPTAFCRRSALPDLSRTLQAMTSDIRPR